MKANELRIGNLFYPIDRSGHVHLPIQVPFKVHTIGFEIEAFKFDQNPAELHEIPKFRLSDLSEIPITEKWLLDFGFEKSTAGEGGDNYVEYYENSISKLIICNWGDGFIMSNSFSHGIRINLKYVHQLQNLFFAIEQKELELSPVESA